MDLDFPPKFLSSLASFLQVVCNKGLNYKSYVKISGNLFVTVDDSGNTVEFIVDEEVLSSDGVSTEPSTSWKSIIDDNFSVDTVKNASNGCLSGGGQQAPDQKVYTGDFAHGQFSNELPKLQFRHDASNANHYRSAYPANEDVGICNAMPPNSGDEIIKQEVNEDPFAEEMNGDKSVPLGMEGSLDAEDVDVSDEGEQDREQSESDREEPRQRYDCEFCPEFFTNHQELKAHQKIHPLQCEFCGKEFKCHSSLRNHRRSHTGFKPFTCRRCGNGFRQKTQLRRHPCTGKRDRFKCDFCDLVFSNHLAYIRHQKTHPCRCDFCGKDFGKDYGHLKEHRRTHTQEKRFFCDCGAGFAIKRDLKRHKGYCTGHPEEYPCALCPQVFTSKLDYLRHQKTHPKTCDFCGKEFKQYKELRRHRLHHIGEKRFVCEICGNKYLHEYSLAEHRRRHTGEKPFVCETCGTGFPSKSELKHHPCGTSLSQEVGQFPCYLCGKIFTNKLELRRHTKDHSKTCDLCDKEFEDFKELKRHRRLHTQNKPFTCSVCMKGFSQKKTLKSHMLKAHSVPLSKPDPPVQKDAVKRDFMSDVSSLSYQGLPDFRIYPGQGAIPNSSMLLHAGFDRDVKPIYQQM